jgi:uncharacterized membrane protein YwaF
MHTILMVSAGLALLAIMLVTGKADKQRAVRRFIAVWLGISLANMIAGTAYAGYTLAEEATVAIAVFGIPFAAALIARRIG